jgi:hypothetical protein
MRAVVWLTALFLMLLSAQGVEAQSPAATTPSVPRAPRPAATAPVVSECLYQGQKFTIGSAMCLSSQLWQVCFAPDAAHSAAWWFADKQPLCSGGTYAPTTH